MVDSWIPTLLKANGPLSFLCPSLWEHSCRTQVGKVGDCGREKAVSVNSPGHGVGETQGSVDRELLADTGSIEGDHVHATLGIQKPNVQGPQGSITEPLSLSRPALTPDGQVGPLWGSGHHVLLALGIHSLALRVVLGRGGWGQQGGRQHNHRPSTVSTAAPTPGGDGNASRLGAHRGQEGYRL